NHATGARQIVIGVAYVADGSAALTVSDDGCGIAENMRDKVLERFVRLDRSRSTPGNGLGLSFVRAIAEAHQARLQLSSITSDTAHPGLDVAVLFPSPSPAVGRPSFPLEHETQVRPSHQPNAQSSGAKTL